MSRESHSSLAVSGEPVSPGSGDGLPDLSMLPLLPILERTVDAVCLATLDLTQVVYANPTLLAWLGVRSSECLGRPAANLFPALKLHESQAQLDAVLQGTLAEATLWTELPTRHGSQRTVRLRVRRVVHPSLTLVGILVQRPEVGASTDSQFVGRVDPLTGLPDRTFLLDRLDSLLASGRASDHQFAILFVDLNDFKQVNDTYGHLVGDRVLCEVVNRMASCVRAGDHVARYGGDEFVVLVGRIRSEKEVKPVVDRIHDALKAPFALPDGEVTLSVSVGMAMAGPETHTAEDLLAAADEAMYASKRPAG